MTDVKVRNVKYEYMFAAAFEKQACRNVSTGNPS